LTRLRRRPSPSIAWDVLKAPVGHRRHLSERERVRFIQSDHPSMPTPNPARANDCPHAPSERDHLDGAGMPQENTKPIAGREDLIGVTVR
jgi:hypothetical protein